MASHSEATAGSFVTTQVRAQDTKYSYSRRRWNAFEAWQEHVRRSAATVGNAFAGRGDRDLRRAVVAG